MDDDSLLLRSVQDPGAFATLVGRHQAAVHGYLVRRAPPAAPDLLGEVWVRAFAARSTFDPARGWLFGVARHVLLAHWRAVRPAPAPFPTELAAPDEWPAVDERLTAAAAAPRLRAALAALAPVERELLLLVTWEQLTPQEAATAVGIPRGTARSRLHRARLAMRDHLTDVTTHDDRTGERA
ncbi:RNA polymerase sigma factor [Pseudonocardia hydrocarbonoxydans]|uniref:DNA-directed RNA polymerase sigma-70 factor n=1 Tax=Pseudonocardia hydrocarbonoxydans TaxID=76726 RepID=A0A4Y3WN87_9PSEU|nr:sigma-70 family RNA polymerase sigma factor [Pseudonocardia hydrocarbonoxydans]GEC19701.1 DNA-directed RNA polymerase sigma-70 factor [Pseudonocardia hydrocarbonoxydans]